MLPSWLHLSWNRGFQLHLNLLPAQITVHSVYIHWKLLRSRVIWSWFVFCRANLTAHEMQHPVCHNVCKGRSCRCSYLTVGHSNTCYQWHLHRSGSVWVSSGGWSQWMWGPASHTECLCSPSSSPSDWPPVLYLWTTVTSFSVHLKHNQILVLASSYMTTMTEMVWNWYVRELTAGFCVLSGSLAFLWTLFAHLIIFAIKGACILNVTWPLGHAMRNLVFSG